MTRLLAALRTATRWCLQFPLDRSQWFALGTWLVLLAVAMLALGGYIAHTTNRDIERADQAAYLVLAEKTRGQPWPAATDGIRNPLFPWLLTRLTEIPEVRVGPRNPLFPSLIPNVADGDRETMFAAGRRLNVRLGALLAILLGVWAGGRMAWLPAVLFATLGGLGVLMPLSTYVGAEIGFYGLFFAAWMLALGLLERLTLSRCALFGAVLALAYLAKPGVTLLSAVFVVVGVVRWWKADDGSGWRRWRPLVGATLALGLAVAMMLPRMIDASRRFHDPLQNTAANCFWGESWADCYPKLAWLNPRLAHKLPPGERPSAQRYFARHGIGGAWQRLTTGIAAQVENVVNPGPKSLVFSRPPSREHPLRRTFPYRGLFLIPPLLAALGFAIALARRREIVLPSAARCQLAFVVLLTGASFGAFGWYHVIAPGSRFIMALYIPVLGSLLVVADALRRRLAATWADAASAAAWALLLGLFLAHMSVIALHPYFDGMRGAF